MWFEQMIRKETGCVSYMIGSSKTGECAVFDPLWDVTPYLEMAKQKGAKIRYIIDSHTHADHVSGARRLARLCKGEVMLHCLADITYAATRVDDGDTLQMGEVVLEVVHTPGHRPEMISMLVTDRTRGQHPWCILTGDFVLVGDLGRPDLAQTGEQGAQMLFDLALPRLRELADYVEIYPGHVAGSTCGRVSSGKSVTTVGYERRCNWLLQVQDRELFVDEMNANQPPRPANLVNIVEINQGKRPLTMNQPKAPALLPNAVAKYLDAGHLLIDIRTPAQFAASHTPGAYNVPLANPNFEQWVGWVTPLDCPLLLVAECDVDVERALHKLAFLGLDQRVKGFVNGGIACLGSVGLPPRKLPQLTVQQLYKHLQQDKAKRGSQGCLQVLDVRECTEWEGGHIAHTHQLSFKQLSEQLAQLPFTHETPIAVVCAGGTRSTIAASILRHYGYQEVYNVIGGMTAWCAAGLPTIECAEADETPLPLPHHLNQQRAAGEGRSDAITLSVQALPPMLDIEKLVAGNNGVPYWLEMPALPTVLQPNGDKPVNTHYRFTLSPVPGELAAMAA